MTNVIGGEPRDAHPREEDRNLGACGERVDGEAGVIATIVAVMKSGATLLADLIDRIVNGIRTIAPLVLGLGCQSTNDATVVAPPVVVLLLVVAGDGDPVAALRHLALAHALDPDGAGGAP